MKEPTGKHPATDPGKPGSKLAEMRALGASGVSRLFQHTAAAILPKQPPPVSAPPVPRETPTDKAKTAIADALAKAETKKMGRPVKVGKPWEAMVPPLSRTEYYRRKEKGEL